MVTRSNVAAARELMEAGALVAKTGSPSISRDSFRLLLVLAGRNNQLKSILVSPLFYRLAKEKYHWASRNLLRLIETVVASLISSLVSSVLDRSSLLDPHLPLAEILDEGWFEGNLVSFECWDVCPTFLEKLLCPRERPSTAELMIWAP
jgi:hypothetical protein